MAHFTLGNANPPVVAAAIAYASRGWAVFPCVPRGKKPATPHGCKDATRDPQVVSRLFTADDNIGLATGAPSGVWVLDVDGEQGVRDLLELENQHGELPQTLSQSTGGGGRHYFFAVTDVPVVNRQRIGGMSIDARGDGGYVIAAPSIHPTGAEYRWDSAPASTAIAEAPSWLVDLVARPSRPVCAAPMLSPGRLDVVDRARRYIAKIPPAISGQGGHSATYTVACALVRDFALPAGDALTLLEGYSQRCEPPWSEKELRHKIESAIAATANEPRGTLLSDATPIWTPEAAKPEPWPEIVPFDVAALPEFPVAVLPGVLRQWVEAESHATQTPAALAGMLALAVCSATIARRVVIEPRPGWHEPTNLFTAILLEPGNRKSAVFSDAIGPLRELEAELVEDARPAFARAKSDRRQDEARLKKLEDAAAKTGDPEARKQAGDLAAELAEQPVPTLPRLIVDDATAEKLGMVLADQGGRIASMSPEGGVFDLMAGLYSKNGIPQFGVYLMGHSGDDLLQDRVTRESVRVPRPAITCAYAIQPAVIEGLAENPAFRGRGLLARFLYAAPQSWIGRREIAPTPVSDSVRETYRQAVRTLAENCGNIGDDSQPFILRLDPDAAALLILWETEIEEMLGDGGDMENMRDWGAKLAGATLRLAAVMHCVVHGPTGRIEGPTLAAAIEIARYLVPHAENVLDLMLAREETADDDAQYILRWIVRHGLREFTKSVAQQQGKRRFPKADDIDPALAELTRRGYIRPKPAEATGPGRPPSPTYEVNPAVFENSNPGKRSVYSKNSASEPENGNLQNIQYAFGQVENQNGGCDPGNNRPEVDLEAINDLLAMAAADDDRDKVTL